MSPKPLYGEPFMNILDVLDECQASNEQRTRVVKAIGRIAQLAEQRAFTPQADGSIPSPPTRLARAPGCIGVHEHRARFPRARRVRPDEAAALVEMIRRA